MSRTAAFETESS